MPWNAIHTFSVGEVATAANVNNNFADLNYVARELDYAQITASPAAVSATTEGTAVAQITGNSVTYDGTRVKVEFYCPQVLQSTSLTATLVFLCGTRVVGHAILTTGASTPGSNPGQPHMVFDTPSAGAHTYSVAMYVSTGNATVVAGAGGSGNLVPAFLRVTVAKQ